MWTTAQGFPIRPEQRWVFATYASLGLGTLERAHEAGLPGWDLIKTKWLRRK
ncbi:hypothetical protein [Streptomyces pseudogriseolus]|uniref:hypothetical protein n=1 Tax=Streptomyces pseudogriseolus TaxID=36817 RepID=UPI003FA22477